MSQLSRPAVRARLVAKEIAGTAHPQREPERARGDRSHRRASDETTVTSAPACLSLIAVEGPRHRSR